MTSPLHITLAQINPTVGALENNVKKICAAWDAAPDNSDLIVFPEMVLCGYPPEDLIKKPAFLKDCENALQKLIAFCKTKKSAAIIPAPWVKDGKTYNAFHVIEHGAIIATHAKHHLPNYGVFDEKRIFVSGPMPDPVPFRGTNLGIMVCEDMWFPDVAAHLKSKGAEILIAPHASPFEIGKTETRLRHARARVTETSLPLLFVNQIGGQDELVFDGHSFALDSNGNILLKLPGFKENITTLSANFPLPSGRGIEGEGETAQIYHALTLALHDYVTKNNFPGILIGLSGGIDSALSAAIAVDALGADKVHGVRLPSVYTSNDSMEDAEILAQNLKIKLDTIPITDTVAALEQTLKNHIPAAGTAHENIQSRARGIILMALSNTNGKMLLSTGNKSEMATGYATLYGDMCGGFNVLKDVYKTTVYELANWRNEQGAVIPARSITKAPTAELKPGQTDQDTLPPYETLDAILKCLIERDMGVEETAAQGHDRTLVQKIEAMLTRAEYKRRQSAPGPKTTPRTLSRDRRYPMTNGF
ncbi:MAG: NAD+ synthase [Alphaproteobacteria bacterium]